MPISDWLRSLLGWKRKGHVSTDLDAAEKPRMSTDVTAVGVGNSARIGFVAICAIMRDEAIGILEWIAYHRAIGVEKFFLYDHESRDDTVSLIMPLVRAGIVDLTHWVARPGQIQAYDDFAARHAHEWRWCAFIDLDEYINPFGFDGLPEWLGRFGHRSGVALQWLNFGPCGHDEPPTVLAMEAYHSRFQDIHPVQGHVKTIVRMDRYLRALDPHSFQVRDGFVANELDEEIGGDGRNYSIQAPMLHDEACINHYYTRSRREWWIKIDRGLADAGDVVENPRNPDWIDLYDRDAINVDRRIMKFAKRTAVELDLLKSLERDRTDRSVTTPER